MSSCDLSCAINVPTRVPVTSPPCRTPIIFMSSKDHVKRGVKSNATSGRMRDKSCVQENDANELRAFAP
eukprot:6186146-Pleurochrysis_carterae.AAC.1